MIFGKTLLTFHFVDLILQVPHIASLIVGLGGYSTAPNVKTRLTDPGAYNVVMSPLLCSQAF